MTMYPMVILCGGFATRLKPLTAKFPKSLVSINGTPFIDLQIKLLSSYNFDNIILCTGFEGELIKEYIDANKKIYQQLGIKKIEFSDDGYKPLGTGGAIKNAFDLLPDNFFVMYGDSYLDFNYRVVKFNYTEKKKLALMTIYKNKNRYEPSNVQYENGEIVKYGLDNSDKMWYIDYGVGIFNKKAFDGFEGSFSLKDVYKKMIEDKQLASYVAPNRFYQIGTFEGIAELENYLKEK